MSQFLEGWLDDALRFFLKKGNAGSHLGCPVCSESECTELFVDVRACSVQFITPENKRLHDFLKHATFHSVHSLVNSLAEKVKEKL